MNYFKLLTKMFLVFTLSLLLVGCSGGGGSSGDSGNVTGDSSSQYVSAAIVLPADDANISILVDSACGAASGFGLYTGFDLNDNNILDESEYIGDPQIICNGADGSNGTDGSDGTIGLTGADGVTSLVVTSTISVGDAECSNGGVLIESGLDDGTGAGIADNSILEADEVLQSEKLCHAVNGADGLTSLIVAEELAIGSLECPAGGTRLHFGVDTNSDGVLAVSEYMSSIDVCDGEGLVDENSSVPTLLNSTGVITENETYGTVAGTIMILSNGGLPISSIALNGSGANNFLVGVNGLIVVSSTASIDYEATPTFNFTATATNSAGDSTAVAVVIGVNNVLDNVPVLATPATSAVDENTVAGTAIVTVAKNGSNVDANTTTSFAIVSGNDGSFAIDNNGAITTVGAGLDYETTESYTLSVKATNDFGDSTPVNVVINLNNILDNVPVLVAPSSTAIYDNTVAGTEVVTVAKNGSNVDENTTSSFTIVSGDFGRFSISAAGVVSTVGTGFDFSSAASYTLVVKATNSVGDSNSVDVVINIVDITVPSVTGVTPLDDTTTANATANLSIVFSENVNVVTGKSFIIYKTDGNEEHTNFDVGAYQVSGSGTNTITIAPNSHLVYGAAHYVKIDASAFKDAADNDFSGIADTTTWNFTVEATSGPCGCVDFDNCDLPDNLQ